jgi:hypothetical protein
MQELPPRRIGMPLRRRRYLQCLEDPADRGCADPVAEVQQLILDSLVSPAVVLGREPLDQVSDLRADRRPARPVLIRSTRVRPGSGATAAWCRA